MVLWGSIEFRSAARRRAKRPVEAGYRRRRPRKAAHQSLEVEHGDGSALQPDAEQRHTVNLTTVLDRRDFGLIWSSPMQKIADDVKITLHIELVPAASRT
jgi:hypothetical protein